MLSLIIIAGCLLIMWLLVRMWQQADEMTHLRWRCRRAEQGLARADRGWRQSRERHRDALWECEELQEHNDELKRALGINPDWEG